MEAESIMMGKLTRGNRLYDAESTMTTKTTTDKQPCRQNESWWHNEQWRVNHDKTINHGGKINPDDRINHDGRINHGGR